MHFGFHCTVRKQNAIDIKFWWSNLRIQFDCDSIHTVIDSLLPHHICVQLKRAIYSYTAGPVVFHLVGFNAFWLIPRIRFAVLYDTWFVVCFLRMNDIFQLELILFKIVLDHCCGIHLMVSSDSKSLWCIVVCSWSYWSVYMSLIAFRPVF